MPVETLVLYSRLAFYPMHLQAFQYLCAHYRIRGTLIANKPASIPSVHRQLGDGAVDHDGSLDVRHVPEGGRWAQARWLRRELRAIRPDAIWVQEEPFNFFLLWILTMYLLDTRTRIAAAACENIFPPAPRWQRLVRRRLWSRIDVLLATATASIEGARAAGMPAAVRGRSLVGGALPPPPRPVSIALPFERRDSDFIVGFAGRICEEKGWKVLLEALAVLPPAVKCIIAGDGPQVPELRQWLARPAFNGRAFYLGLLPKATLWTFYRALDCLVVPSLTFPHWKEQFGGVLADAMAIGLPIIGSDSGAIPEVTGPAGLIVPENDAAAIAAAVQRLRADAVLHQTLGAAGRRRFEAEFCIPAYARKIAQALGLKEQPRAG